MVDISFLGAEEQHHLGVVAEALGRGHATLFCGAGLSFNARRRDGSDRPLPGWWELTAALAEELPGVSADSAALEIADLYEASYGRARLTQALLRLLPEKEYEPGEVHRLIPLMGFSEIITTNFDSLIERGFLARHIRPRVVVHGRDLVGQQRPRVIKVNGCFDRNPSGVVITGEDFRRHPTTRPLLTTLLTSRFVESTVLFVGFSLEDPAFRSIFGRVRDILGREGRMAYAIQGGIAPSKVGFWASQGLRILGLWSGAERPALDFSQRLEAVFSYVLERSRDGLFHAPAPMTGLPASARRLARDLGAGDPPPDAVAVLGRSVDACGATPSRALAVLGSEPEGVAAALAGRGGVGWQRLLIRWLGGILAERQQPAIGAAGCFAHPAARGALAALLQTLLPSAGRVPRWLPEVPVLALEVALGIALEDPRAGQPMLWRWLRFLDVRCLGAERNALQRAAARWLSAFGSAADVRLVRGALLRSEVGPAEARHLERRARRWVSLVGEGAAETGRLAEPLARRIAALDADVRFRLEAWFDGPEGHRGPLYQGLEQLRVQSMNEAPLDAHRLALIHRHTYLYRDYGGLAEETASPFHEEVRSHNAAVLARSREVAGEANGLAGQLHRLVLAWTAGKALHRVPPGELEGAWWEAGRLLAAGRGEEVPWELLLMWALPADGAQLIHRRGALLQQAADRQVLELAGLLSAWGRRLAGGRLAGLPLEDGQGRSLEGRSGLSRSLEGLAGLVEWLARRAPRGRRLARLCGGLLASHGRVAGVRGPVLRGLSRLSHSASPAAVLKALGVWWAQPQEHGAGGLAGLDWARLLEDPAGAGLTRDPRLLVAWQRACAPRVRRSDYGRDVIQGVLALWSAAGGLEGPLGQAVREQGPALTAWPGGGPGWLERAAAFQRAGVDWEEGGPARPVLAWLSAITTDRLRPGELRLLLPFASALPDEARLLLLEQRLGAGGGEPPGWPQERRERTLALVLALRRGPEDGLWARAGRPWVDRLLRLGATAGGAAAGLGPALEARQWADLETTLVSGLVGAAGWDTALTAQRVASVAGRPLESLEEHLVHAALERDQVVEWLGHALEDDGFVVRHRTRLRLLRARLEAWAERRRSRVRKQRSGARGSVLLRAEQRAGLDPARRALLVALESRGAAVV